MDLVGADVLGDAAGLARGDVGLADRVEQRRLAVVDVAHDRDDRRARLEVLVGVLELGLGVGVLGRRDDLDLLVELVGEDLDRVVGQRLRERRHLAEAHQLLDDLGDAHAELLGDVLDRRAGVDADDVGLAATRRPAATAPRRCRDGGGRRDAAGGAGGPPPGPPPGRRDRPGPAARGLRVDDDAAHAAAGAGSALALQRGARGPLAPVVRRRCPGLAAWACLAWASAGSSGRVSARGARAVPWPKPARAGAGCSLLLRGAVARDALGLGLPVSAASASFSSTAVAAALTSRPAAFSRLMTSADGMSYCLASSWTRFLAMCG